MKKFHLFACALAACFALLACSADAQESQIRKNLAEGIPDFPKIEEVRKTPINGLYEVRLANNQLVYSDATGKFFIQGEMIDVASKRNLTEERITAITSVPFDKLPFQDAFTIVRGNGKRKLAIFSDPNCGYCKRIEQDLQKVDNVTVYMFLYPILGADSTKKAEQIWCAKDKGKVWLDWMLQQQTIPDASCDTAAIKRNVAYGQKQRITGTPAVLFENGTRVPGALPADKIEAMLAQSK